MARKKSSVSENPTQPQDGRPIDFEAIRTIAKSSQILDIATMHFSGKALRPLLGEDIRTLRQAVSVRAARVSPTPEDLVVSAVDFRFTVSDTEATICEVQGAVMVAYRFSTPPENIPPDALDTFAEVNGIYSAWPYIRELVGSTASRLGLMGAVLPIWTVPSSLPPVGEYQILTSTPASADEVPPQ